MTRLLLLVAFAAFADPRPADACSVTRTFVPPTNFELVAQAPEIVIVKVIAGTAGGSSVEVQVTRALRGTKLPKGARFPINGSLDRYLGASRDRFDFKAARPGAYTGACTAWDFALDKHYLLLLDAGLGTLSVPFARVNEEIDPTSDPWLAAVTAYIKIADAPATARRKQIDALIARGKTKKPSKVDAAIAADLAAHLVTPSNHKTFAELEQMLASATDARLRSRVVMAIGTGNDPAAKQFLVDLLAAVAAKTATVDDYTAYAAIGSYFERFPDPNTIGSIVRYYAAAKAQGHDRWALMLVITKQADASHAKDMLAALATTSDEEAGRFVDYFARFPSKDATRIFRARIGKDFEKARFELVIGIAGMGDPDVIAWAKKKLAAKPDDNRWIAVYAVARSPLPAADALARQIIARNGPDVVSLADGYGDAHHANVDARLADLGKLKLSSDGAEALKRTVDQRAKP
jgi:hypothetical protein